MADGGEGFADILCHYIHGKMIEVDTLDLQGRRIRAAYAYNEEKNSRSWMWRAVLGSISIQRIGAIRWLLLPMGSD